MSVSKLTPEEYEKIEKRNEEYSKYNNESENHNIYMRKLSRDLSVNLSRISVEDKTFIVDELLKDNDVDVTKFCEQKLRTMSYEKMNKIRLTIDTLKLKVSILEDLLKIESRTNCYLE